MLADPVEKATAVDGILHLVGAGEEAVAGDGDRRACRFVTTRCMESFSVSKPNQRLAFDHAPGFDEEVHPLFRERVTFVAASPLEDREREDRQRRRVERRNVLKELDGAAGLFLGLLGLLVEAEHEREVRTRRALEHRIASGPEADDRVALERDATR